MTDFVLLSTTTDSSEEAEKIATSLIEQRLAACVQIVPQVRSVYRWQEKIERSDEWLCLVKTRRTLAERVETVIAEQHSYDCPEVIVVPIESGSAAYLQWLDAQIDSP